MESEMEEVKTAKATNHTVASSLPHAATYSSGNAPAVSIIMPCYNVEQYIGEALDSVFRQTFTDYEIIVVNDGSTDELEQRLAPYLDRIVYLKQQNAGPSAARNRAIQIARGHYLAFLDPDDKWKPEYLRKQIALIESDATIDVLYTDAVLFGNPLYEGKTFMQLCPSQGEVTLRSLISEECHVMVSALMRRDVVLKVGLLDESLGRSEDFDLWTRIVSQGHRIAYHREPLVYYRRRPEGLTSDGALMCKGILKVFDKLACLDLSAVEADVLRRRRSHYVALLCLHEGRKAFFAGDQKTAIAKLREANSFFRSPKLRLTMLLLRTVPGILMKAYQLRDSVMMRASTGLL